MTQPQANEKPLSADLLAILVCPRCKTKVELNADNTKLVCPNPECKREYRIENGIPVMLVED
jgi:uncharacterized protein YbaR (Trm112 family)